VKIKGTCRRCGREFFVEQVRENGGLCPWDGKPFQADYAAVLVDALVLDERSVLDEIRGHLERLERTYGRQRA
jgi:hypothetical protein